MAPHMQQLPATPREAINTIRRACEAFEQQGWVDSWGQRTASASQTSSRVSAQDIADQVQTLLMGVGSISAYGVQASSQLATRQTQSGGTLSS